MLHIVNKSYCLSTTLQSCLRLARPGHALLLTEDAIYAATQASAALSGLASAVTTLKVYALQPDVEARGMAGKLADGVTAIDYAGERAMALEVMTDEAADLASLCTRWTAATSRHRAAGSPAGVPMETD